MNPAGSDHQPSFELPQPHVEQAGGANEAKQSVEKPAAPELQKSASNGAPTVMPTPASAAAQVSQAHQAPVATPPATNPATNPMIADDSDVIEKEWVDKAKAIVAQTKHDPHQQNKQITKFKADYIKKRYNKDLKVSE